VPLVIFLVILVAAELGEALLAGGRSAPAARRRVGFAGLAGGGMGAAAGFAFPLLGSVWGGLAGSLLGSLVGALVSRLRSERFGDVAARVVATAMKVSAGVAIATFTLLSLIRGV
jgi:hypothetical protein